MRVPVENNGWEKGAGRRGQCQNQEGTVRVGAEGTAGGGSRG